MLILLFVLGFAIMPYVLFQLLVFTLIKCYEKTSWGSSLAKRVGQKQPPKVQLLELLSLTLLSSFGLWQVLQYYLFSGAYFWYVILTAGLILVVYIAPLAAIKAPFLEASQEPWGFFKKLYWQLVTTFTFMWGLVLILDQEAKIYSDESGSTYQTGSLLLKKLGGMALLLVVSYLLVTLSAKFYLSAKKIRKEDSVVTIIWESCRENLKRSSDKWQKNPLYRRNQPLFVSLLPLASFGITLLGLILFNQTLILSSLLIYSVPLFSMFFLLKLIMSLKKQRWKPAVNYLLLIAFGTIWLIMLLLLFINGSLNWESYQKNQSLEILIDLFIIPVSLFAFIWTVRQVFKQTEIKESPNS